MIKAHQPTIFPDSLNVAVSSREDGNMAFRVPDSIEEKDFADAWIRQNRRRFLGNTGINMSQTALVYVTYDVGRDYATYRQAGEAEYGTTMQEHEAAMPADGLATDQAERALFLPLADCRGLVLYDSRTEALMVSHLGRHSTNADGAQRSVAFMQETFGTRPDDVLAWLSPGVGRDSYKMLAHPVDSSHHDFVSDERWREHRQVKGEYVYLDIASYNQAGLEAAGVPAENIEVSHVDTALDERYPSHSQGEASRFAIVAMRRAL